IGPRPAYFPPCWVGSFYYLVLGVLLGGCRLLSTIWGVKVQSDSGLHNFVRKRFISFAMVYGSGVIPTENPESISTASDRKTQTGPSHGRSAYDDTAAISLSGPDLSRSSFRTADHFTVRVFQPVDHGNRQGHGDNIEGLATHKMITA